MRHVGSFVVACRLLMAVCRLLSSCDTWAPERMGSVVVACGLSCPVACGMCSSCTRDRTGIPCIARPILNHWTTREVPGGGFLIVCFFNFQFYCIVVRKCYLYYFLECIEVFLMVEFLQIFFVNFCVLDN